MNCIIIDDDKPSRRIIEEYIAKTHGLTLINSYASAIEAINAFKGGDEIHLIFLDIEMPEMSGLDFLRTIKDPPQIVIISAKESYALDAFEFDVTDYLLKPISYTRFFKAVTKVTERLKAIKYSASGERKEDEIFIKKRSSLFRIKYDDILWIEALENYIKINTFHTSYTIHFTLKRIFDKLPSSMFKRVHRSYIVNIHKINYIEDNNIIMHTEEEKKSIPIGKSYKDKLLEEINLMTK
ncbi:MAG: response regulator transcription factor [Bacteroidia bacterium]|nr:response regulator transcription factor [Bacteroidia bacterium]